MTKLINEEMVEAPHGDPHYHANVHRELINRASGPQKEISLGAHIYRHLSTHPDESHIASHYEKTIYPILKKHGFPREDHGPVGPGHPRHDEHLRFHREFLPDVHKAWREMDKNNPHTAKLLSIADKEAKRKIAERESEKEAKRQKGIEANKKRMNEESINEAAKPGAEHFKTVAMGNGEHAVHWKGKRTPFTIFNGSMGASGFGNNIYGIHHKTTGLSRASGTLHQMKSVLMKALIKDESKAHLDESAVKSFGQFMEDGVGGAGGVGSGVGGLGSVVDKAGNVQSPPVFPAAQKRIVKKGTPMFRRKLDV